MADYDSLSNRETKELNFKPFENLQIDSGGNRWKGVLRRWLPHLISAGAFCCLLIVSFIFWTDVSRRFPDLPPGAFYGEIDGAAAGNPGSSLRLYVERQAGAMEVLFAVLEAGWSPQIVTPIPADPAGSATGGEVLPITLQGPDSRLILSGAMLPDGSFQGLAENPAHKSDGKWTLRAMDAGQISAASSDTVQNTRLSLMLRAELKDVEAKISAGADSFEKQKAEIENLSSVVAEGDKLKSRANEKYNAVMAELRKVNQAQAERSEEARKLESAFSVSQRVTGMGKLASLSRESLEREWRWTDSMLRGQTESEAEDLGAALERGRKILDIKREIAAEEQKISEMAAQLDPTDPDAGYFGGR